jgi:cytochrome c553
MVLSSHILVDLKKCEFLQKMAGECRLENMQTLCVVCHTNVTTEQNRQRRSELKRAQQRLQMRVKRLSDRLNGRKRSRLEVSPIVKICCRSCSRIKSLLCMS